MADRIVTVFGGTGFLGRHVVRHVLGRNLLVRIASRHPELPPGLSQGTALQSIVADVNDEAAVAAAVAGAFGVVNAVSLYVGCSRPMSRMSLRQSFAYCGRRPRHSFMSWPDHVSIPIKNCWEPLLLVRARGLSWCHFRSACGMSLATLPKLCRARRSPGIRSS